MKDFSLLLIKPEALRKRKKIKEFLKQKNYKIIDELNFKNWTKIIRKIYFEFSKKELNNFIKDYKKSKWKNNFIIIIISHKKLKTIKKLKKDQGNFINYQSKKEDTLRSRFGLSKKYNSYFKNKKINTTFTYNGFHVPKSKKELEHHLKLFRIKKPQLLS